MIKRKPLLFFMVFVAIFVMSAATAVEAQDSCGLLPGINANYEGKTELANGNCLYTYSFYGNKVGTITDVCVLLYRLVDVVESSALHIGLPCEGIPVGDNQYWDHACEQIGVCGTPQVDPQGNYVFQFEARTCGETKIGFMVDAVKSGTGGCEITGPAYALPGYAAVQTNAKVGKIRGIEYCADINPDGSFVPFEQKLPYECEYPNNTLAIDQAFTFGNSGGLHKNLTIRPGNAPQGAPVLAVGNPDECTWICFWGSCCGPIGPDCCKNNTPPCP